MEDQGSYKGLHLCKAWWKGPIGYGGKPNNQVTDCGMLGEEVLQGGFYTLGQLSYIVMRTWVRIVFYR